MPARIRAKLPPESEESLQTKVMQLAKTFGWRAVHFRPARTAHGWRTAFTGDKGFPDCVLVRRGRLIFAELKKDGEYEPTSEQAWWLNDLHFVAQCEVPKVNTGVEVYVWHPADWNEIVSILR